MSIPSKYLFLCTRRKFGFNKKIRRNLLIPPAGYLGKYTAHNDYTEEEVRRISIAATILVSAAAFEVGGVLASGRVTHVVANDPEDHDAPDVIKKERERERRERERERRGGERGGADDNEEDGGDGGLGGRGGRPHPSEKIFLRTLVVVEAPVPDEDMDDGGDGGPGGTD